MKEVVSISLGSSKNDYEFHTDFLGHPFRIRRFGTDGNKRKALELISVWQHKAHAIGLGMVSDHGSVGGHQLINLDTQKLEKAVRRVPVTTGSHLRKVLQRWAVRHMQLELNNIFNNAKVLFLSGTLNYDMAVVMSEYTQNLYFADPILELGAPKLLTSLQALEWYAAGSHKVRQWAPTKTLSPQNTPLKHWNHYIIAKAMQKASIIVGTYEQLAIYSAEELAGKTVISSTISDENLKVLKGKGWD